MKIVLVSDLTISSLPNCNLPITASPLVPQILVNRLTCQLSEVSEERHLFSFPKNNVFVFASLITAVHIPSR